MWAMLFSMCSFEATSDLCQSPPPVMAWTPISEYSLASSMLHPTPTHATVLDPRA